MKLSIDPGTEQDSGFNHAGIVVINALAYTGDSAIFIVAENKLNLVQIHTSQSYSFTDEKDKICIYKKESTGNIILKNNTSVRITIRISKL